MNRRERIRRILELLEEKGNLSTVFLARVFNVSESSIRRDLIRIISDQQQSEIERVHGGLILNRKMKGLEYMFELKLGLNVEEKKAIAQRASEFIENGDNIVIDSGTTCLFLSQLLYQKKNVHVITLDVKIAEELGRYEGIEAIIIGGIIRPGYYTVGGLQAVKNLDQFTPNKVFLSVDALDIHTGITNVSEFEVGTKRKIINAGKQVFVIADSSKFGKSSLYRVADLSSVDTIITDGNVDPETATGITDCGIELIVV